MLNLRRKTSGERGAVHLGVMLTACLACAPHSAPEIPCDELQRRWNAIVSNPALLRCVENTDCAAVSTPTSCLNGEVLIGFGAAVNRSAYGMTEGRSLEQAYRRQACAGITFDAAPALVMCAAGTCQAIQGTCMMRPDAALDI